MRKIEIFTFIVLLPFLFHFARSQITFNKALSNGLRTVEGSNVQYALNLTITTNITGQMDCIVTLSTDDIPSSNDYFVSCSNNLCAFSDCPVYSTYDFNGNGPVREEIITVTDSRSPPASPPIYAIVSCSVYKEFFCYFNNPPSPPACYYGDAYIPFLFIAQYSNSIAPPTTITIIMGTTGIYPGDTVSASVTSDGSDVTYEWMITNLPSLEGSNVEIIFNTAGTYTVTVNASNAAGWTTSSQTVNVGTSQNNDGQQGPSSSGNAGAIAAGVIVPIVVIAILVFAGVWYYREKRREGTNPVPVFLNPLFGPPPSKGLSVTELNHTTDVSTSSTGISSPVSATKTIPRAYFPPTPVAEPEEESTAPVANVEYEPPMPVVPIPVFEGDLEALSQQINEAPILPIVWNCCEYIEAKGLTTEGIFRIPGSLTEMKELKASFDRGQPVDLFAKVKDPLTVAGLLKLHFRDGREENAPKKSYPALYSARNNPEDMRSVLLCEFSPLQISTARRICYTFSLVCQHSDENLMHPDNLAKVFGPSLFRDMSFGNANAILACWIKNYNTVFNF